MSKPKIISIEEVVIAVKDVEAAANLFKELFGFNFKDEWTLPGEMIRIRSERIGETQLQLMEPTSPESVVAKFLSERGEGLNHIAFRVNGLDKMVKELKSKGVRLIPETPVEIDHPLKKGVKLKYIFIHPKSAHGVLIELIEET